MVSGRLDGRKLFADIEGYRMQINVDANDGVYTMFTSTGAVQFAPATPDYGEISVENDPEGELVAPMNGTIIALLVEPGKRVDKDQPLVTMEAMKMEHTVRAPTDGVVIRYNVKPGDLVDGGIPLLVFEQ